MQNDIVVMENSVLVPQKINNKIFTGYSNSTSEHTLERTEALTHVH
jgi:hypothetical protein